MAAQEIETEQRGERMLLHAAHKSEANKPFARAAGAIFALFDRVTGLRSVIAQLRRNPRINPAERHRIEREAVARRHQRERFMLERKYKALSRLDAREKRSLETVIRREMQAMEAGHEQKAQTRHDQIEVNKLDITLPGEKLLPLPRRSAMEKTPGRRGRRNSASVGLVWGIIGSTAPTRSARCFAEKFGGLFGEPVDTKVARPLEVGK